MIVVITGSQTNAGMLYESAQSHARQRKHTSLWKLRNGNCFVARSFKTVGGGGGSGMTEGGWYHLVEKKSFTLGVVGG